METNVSFEALNLNLKQYFLWLPMEVIGAIKF